MYPAVPCGRAWGVACTVHLFQEVRHEEHRKVDDGRWGARALRGGSRAPGRTMHGMREIERLRGIDKARQLQSGVRGDRLRLLRHELSSRDHRCSHQRLIHFGRDG